MGTSFGAPQTAGLLDKCVLYAPLTDCSAISGGYNVYPILPSGVTVTNNGSWFKDNLGNNQYNLHQTSSNYITITDSPDFYLGANPFSVCFWVVPSIGALTTQYVICGQVPTDGATANTSFMIMLYNGIPRWYNWTGSAIIAYNSTYGALSGGDWSNNVMTSGTYYHLAFVGDGSTVKIYINSTQYGSVACTNVADSSLNFYLGGSPITPSTNWHHFAGMLMHFGLWKGRALSVAEIKLMMNLTHPVTGRGLMPANGEYWRLS